MNFISLCSGIEAASVAFGPLGWKAIAFSEIEGFPSAVLAPITTPLSATTGTCPCFATGPMNCLPMLTPSLAARHAKPFLLPAHVADSPMLAATSH